MKTSSFIPVILRHLLLFLWLLAVSAEARLWRRRSPPGATEAGSPALATRSPQWWRRVWPQIRRLMACVDKHSHLRAWPGALASVLRWSGLPAQQILPADDLWSALGTRVPVQERFPDVVLVTQREKCSCGRKLTERRAAAQCDHIRLLTRDGTCQAWHYPVVCKHCALVYYSYYTVPLRAPISTQGKRLRSKPWAFDDHGPENPKAVLVTPPVAVDWQYLEDLDARMVRCPFAWTMLGRGYCDRFRTPDNGLRAKAVAQYLFAAWQWYVLLLWRRECHADGFAVPPLQVIREASRK